MPVNEQTEVPLSQQFNEARGFLLETFKAQLDDLLVEQLNPQLEGVPFINFGGDSPQLCAIKKVINCLFYAEIGLKHWEGIDTSTMLGKTKAAPQGIKALIQVYKFITMIDDATPEIRWVVTENYSIFAPIFSRSYDVIQSSGWLPQFMEMGITDKASTAINQGIGILGPDLAKWSNANPLISTFKKISQLMETAAGMQSGVFSESEKHQQIDVIRSILDDLDSNALIGQLTCADFEDSKAVKDLFNWFKNIQEDGFEFTRKSIQEYVSWANYYLPQLILLADQLERQNYLKSGLLSQTLCSRADLLGEQINTLLSSGSSFNITQRVISTDSLKEVREEQIKSTQIKSVQAIMAAEGQHLAAIDFFRILQPYKGRSLADITEPDRISLRLIYPKLQMVLAHANLGIENNLTEILNTTGLEKTADPPRTWWQLAADGVSYVASFVVSPEITKLLETKVFVENYISTQIESEQFKIKIGEKAREKLNSELGKAPLNQRVIDRIKELKNKLNHAPQTEIVPDKFVTVKPFNLTNLRGTLTYFQRMQLSTTVHNTRTTMAILISRHFAEEDKNYFSTIPYVISPDDPEGVVQIKQVENDLFTLEQSIKHFESINLDYGIIIYLRSYLAIASAASQLKKRLTLLTPDAQKTLAPVLNQVMAYGATLSGINYRNSDLTSIEQLKKSEILPLVPAIEVLDRKEYKPSLTEEKFSEDAKSSSQLDYIDKISTARAVLLQKFKTTMSLPISSSLTPQKEGVPFIHVENNAPQIAAIKKMINSMYYAESALKIWQGIDTSTTLGKVAAAHQGVAALSQVYKSLELFTEVTPEVQGLIRENYDLIKPVLDGARDLIKREGWTKQFNALDVTQKVGSVLGIGIALVQPETAHSTQTASLVALLSELPALLNNMTNLIDKESEVSVHKLRISQERIDAISSILELIFEEKSPIINLLKGPRAILGLIELNKRFQQQSTNLQDATVRAYQQWLEEGYPDLLLMFDEIETRYLMKPGTLSKSIVFEIDKINDKLNEVIETKPNSNLKRINLSFDLAETRKKGLKAKKMEHWMDVFLYKDQMKSADIFFDTLRKYSGKSFGEIEPLDRITLHRAFAMIQLAMTNSNLDVANECVSALNHLETMELDPRGGAKVSIEQIMKQESSVKKYIIQRQQSCTLKINVIDHAIYYINSQALELIIEKSDEFSMEKLQQKYSVINANRPIVEPGELKPIPSPSMHSIRGNLAYIQELKISSVIENVAEELTEIARTNFSRHVQGYLTKPKEQLLHSIKDNDPLIVRQIKEVENGLYHLQTAFVHFEQMKKNDTLVSQARALVEIQYEAQQLKGVLERLTPELKAHYGPLAIQMLNFSKKIQSIDYNKEDFNDLIFVIQSTKKELLKRKNPRDPRLEKAFFESNKREAPAQIITTESALKKAAKLGIKYLHLASPQLQQATNYLRSRYTNVFGEQTPVIHSLSRTQLADEELMRSEISRLKLVLERRSGFNMPTIRMILNLIKQMQRVGIQASELTVMINQLVTNDFVQIKEKIYQALIIKLSEEEDYLSLRPGTLINPAMAAVNQLFLSMAVELDMPFNKKLALLTDNSFLNIVMTQTHEALEALKSEFESQPENHEIAFKIKIKEDKLVLLEQQIKALADNDVDQTKRALLDIQFEVYLRDHLKRTNIKKPIINQYEAIVRSHYNENKDHFLSSSDSAKDLYQSIQIFERNNVGNYLIVDEAYQKLHHFSLKLPAKNKDLKDYIDGINQKLISGDIPIDERALKVKSLPDDAVFIEKLSTADDGTSFLKKFKQFLKRATSSILEGITTGVSICYLYHQKKIEHSIKNIEKSIRLDKAANTSVDLNIKHDEEGGLDQIDESEIEAVDESDELGVSPENDEEEISSNRFN